MMSSLPVLHRFTVAEYDQMGEIGIFGEDDHVELIDGEIIEMSPIGISHAWCVNQVLTHLIRTLGESVVFSVQNPIEIGERDLPQPDITIVRLSSDRSRHPRPADVLLPIEISDTSRDFDRNVKLRRYAEAGIAESWLVDLVTDTVERHSQPGPGGYRLIALAGRKESLPSTTLPAFTLIVDDILD